MHHRSTVLALVLLVACGDPAVTDPAAEPIGTGGIEGLEPLVLESASTPVVGGTLALLSNGWVAAADPVTAEVALIDPASGAEVGRVVLPDHSEPGRMVEGADGVLWVALRRGGRVVAIDPATATITGELAVCPAPRGIDFDPATGTNWLACASGELQQLDSSGILASFPLGPDLRDVVVDEVDGTLWVSRFKSAQILHLDGTGEILETRTLRNHVVRNPDVGFVPTAAWRMIPDPDGGVFVSHLRSSTATIDLSDGRESPYAAGATDSHCGGIQHSAVSSLRTGTSASTGILDGSPLPVDLALAPNGTMTLVVAGSSEGTKAPASLMGLGPAAWDAADGCHQPTNLDVDGDDVFTAVLYDAAGRQIAQTMQPFTVRVDGVLVATGGGRGDELDGFRLFHQNANEGVSCAGCHPEGHEDGHVWAFSDVGRRRTQALGGGIMETAPFHWAGEFDGLHQLTHEVFDRRMGGNPLSSVQVDALGTFVGALASAVVTSSGTVDEIAEGKALFESAEVGCAACHTGSKMTNNLSFDVGTGGVFQVPMLRGVANRLPLMHDGCAETLAERFDSWCGGDAHGDTSQLDEAQIGSLVAYLETL